MSRRALPVVLAAAAVVGVFATYVLRSPRPGPERSADCREGGTCGEDEPAPTVEAAATSAAPSSAASPRVVARATSVSAMEPQAAPARREDVDRLLADGKVMDAVEAFRAVVAAEPTAKNHGDLGSLLYRLTAFDEAATHLRAAAELDPGNADRWIALANVYYRKVNPGEAWKAEKRAREAEPGLELGRDAEGMRVRKTPPTERRP